ncbi:MAG: class I SAM-dependent methyltransferase [Verrucomicrobiae bacterium]|nr:class I SAM-dependent methyltransferase [Verrucomicrobiae bacterium]
MPKASYSQEIERGLRVAEANIYHEDKIWSRYSNDKVDIGEVLASVIRTLHKALPITKPMKALSIGSGAEPQFRILETAFRGGLHLLDMDDTSLDILRERIHRQATDHASVVRADFKEIFRDARKTRAFMETELAGGRVELITLHHSLYYAAESDWLPILANLYKSALASTGALHAVLMANQSDDPATTTWLYNHFVGKFFGARNEQDLRAFAASLKKRPLFRNAQVLVKTNRVRFRAPDFEKLMAVVWMILLYPDVHPYSEKQRREITEFVHQRFWQKDQPLIQLQDHMVIYRGIPFKGLI